MLSTRIKSYLDAGRAVILVKAANKSNPKSYSLVTRYEGTKVWRTPFEALSPEEVEDFHTGKFTLQHLDENPRVSIYKTIDWIQRETFEEDDEYDDEEDVNYVDEIAELKLEVAFLKELLLAKTTQADAPTPNVAPAKHRTTKSWRWRISI